MRQIRNLLFNGVFIGFFFFITKLIFKEQVCDMESQGFGTWHLIDITDLSDVGQVAIQPLVVQTVADDKVVGDFETN